MNRLNLVFGMASEINANTRDGKDYAWSLPPGFRPGAMDRGKYAAIAESNRMPLRFRKSR